MKVVTEGIREEKDGSLSSGSHQSAFFFLFPPTVLLSLPRLLEGCSAVFLVCISRARETPRHAFLYIIAVSAPRLTLAIVWVIWMLYRGSVSAALEGCEGGSADFLPIKLNRKQQSHRQLLLPPPSLSSETRKHINHTSPTALCSPVSREICSDVGWSACWRETGVKKASQLKQCCVLASSNTLCTGSLCITTIPTKRKKNWKRTHGNF